LAIISESVLLLDEVGNTDFDQWARTTISKIAAVAVPDM
jgi:hypothetical protein